MATANPSSAVAGSINLAPVARGFPDLDCPCCGNQGSVTVHLGDLHEFHCGECDADFDSATVLEFIDKWQRVLAWIELAPVLPPE
jgi:hypothetical protein